MKQWFIKTLFTLHGRCERLNKKAIWLSFSIGILCYGFIFIPVASSMEDPQRIEKVKSAFVLNIVRFVKWPEEAFAEQADTLYLCISRDNLVANSIRSVEGKKASGKRLSVLVVDGKKDSQQCHVMYFTSVERLNYFDTSVVNFKPSLLTIIDLTDVHHEKIAKHQSMIALVRNGTRIGFQINLDKVKHAGLVISSRLLKLATIIGEES